MSDDATAAPSWFLISVLFSTFPLTATVAHKLHEAAFELYRKDADARELRAGLTRGEVRNLRKQLLLGTIAGHAFEARLDTERGEGLVRYLLTEEGISAFASAQPRELLN